MENAMLEQLWESATSKYIVGMKNGDVKRSSLVNSAEQAEDVAQDFDAQGWDVYFTPTGFDGTRAQTNAAAIGSLWIDLDCGDGKEYADKQEAFEALEQWCSTNNFPSPSTIVDSGYGLHCYWALDGWYTHDDWLPVAKQFKQAHRVGGLRADPARTADSASLMRMPGTHNHKRGEPQPVKVLLNTGKRYGLDDLRQRIPAVGPQGTVPDREDTGGEWGTKTEMPAGDAEAIAAQCAQMGAIRDNRGAVAEPYWRAGLSILWRCADRETYIHEWSKGDERYDANQTHAKAANTAGPATCQHFDEVNPGGCTGCPFAGKITSPILLSMAPEEVTPEQQELEPWRVNQINNFTITAQGVWFKPPLVEGEDPEPPKLICQFPLWIEEVRERALTGEEQDRSMLVMQWTSLDGRRKRGIMPSASLTEPREFRAWLGDHTLSFGTLDLKLMQSFISQMSAESVRKRGVRQYHETLGWCPKGFVVGDRIVTQHGVEPALVQSSNPISRVSYVGNVDDWVKGVNVLGRKKEYLNHAFAVLAGFGSPVLGPTDHHPAVLSLCGTSGAGKTLAMNAGLSIVGSPDLLAQGSTATNNAIELQIGANKDVQYGLDEVTQYPPKRLAELIYLAVNGVGKASATRDRDMRSARSWNNVSVVTTNQPILEFAQEQIPEQHRRRLLELYFANPMAKEDAEQVVEAILHHYGTAAPVFLQELCKHRTQLPAMFAKVEDWIVEKIGVPDANRFAVWLLTAAWIGGTIAKKVGLLPGWDIDQIVMHAGKSLQEGVRDTLTNEERAHEVLREWLTENVAHISHWDAAGDLGQPTDRPIARVMGGDLIAVHASRMKELMREYRIPSAAMEAALEPAVVERKNTRLAPGAPGVWAYVMDMRKLGFSEELASEKA